MIHSALRSALGAALLAAPAAAQLDPALLAGMEARSLGPAGMSGRVAAIDALAADPDVIYVGAATGGLWRSRNAGLTWEPLFDDQPVASIGAVAIDQARPDVVWVGTGEGNPRNSSSVGRGVFKSLDGGDSWTQLDPGGELARCEKVTRLLLDPRDGDVAWVAALGTTWGESHQRGVFRTEDGGATWTHALEVDERTGCADLAMAADNPDRLLAAMWDHRRTPYSFRSGGPGSGLYLTLDGGASWRRLTPEDGLPEGELGRIGVAFSRSHPHVAYALVEAKRSALLRSDDGGASWRTVGSEVGVAPRPFYFADIRVDPADPDRVYSLDFELRVSTDGGATFERTAPWTVVHPDHHALWIHPDDPTHLIDGNDGGVTISRDQGATWRFVRNLPLAQFYHLAVDDAQPYNVYGGMQDNGSWRGPSEVWENGGIRNHHWQEVGFGDGFGTLPIPGDLNAGYAMSQGGWLMRWRLDTGERKLVRPDAPDGVELRFNWNAGIAVDPHDADTVYYGSQFVHRSRDRGETWEVVSPDLTTDEPEWQRQDESGGLTRDVTAAENYCSILSIAPSPLEEGLIWVGTDDGRLHVTRDGGASWTRLDERLPDVPAGTWIPHVEASKHDPAECFVVLDDHRRSNWTPYVLRTADHGATWESLATDDLDGYVHVLEQDPVDPDLLFLGTEFGLWFSLDGGAAWSRWRHGVPTVGVRALVVHPREHDLVVGTHGRAAYVVDDVRPLRALSAEVAAKPLHLFPVPPAIQHTVKQTAESRFPAHEDFRGDNRPYGARLSFWLSDPALPHPDADAERARKAAERAAGAPEEAADAEEEGDGDEEGDEDEHEATLVVEDADGRAVRRLELDVHQGLNRFTWDLRERGFRGPGSLEDDDFDREAEPGGPQVLPGTYRLRLTRGEHVAETTVEVLPDPRDPVPAADRRANLEARRRLAALSGRLADALERLRGVRGDVDAVLARARADVEPGSTAEPHAELVAAGKALRKSLDELERTLWAPPEEAGILPDDHVAGRIGDAQWQVGSTWSAPTPAHRLALAAAERALAEGLERTNALLEGDVAAFRARVDAAGLQLLAPRAPLAPPTAAGGR